MHRNDEARRTWSCVGRRSCSTAELRHVLMTVAPGPTKTWASLTNLRENKIDGELMVMRNGERAWACACSKQFAWWTQHVEDTLGKLCKFAK
eukprot:1704647-Prymnesium_polylepis.2